MFMLVQFICTVSVSYMHVLEDDVLDVLEEDPHERCLFENSFSWKLVVFNQGKYYEEGCSHLMKITNVSKRKKCLLRFIGRQTRIPFSNQLCRLVTYERRSSEMNIAPVIKQSF